MFKLYFKNPRPIWIINEASIQCEGGYGNPSGHSICSIFFFLTIYEIVIKDILIKERYRKIALISCCVLAIFVAISRVMLGNHSFNQVIFGFFLGLLYYFLIFHIILDNFNLEKDELLLEIIHNKKIILTIGYCLALILTLGMLFYYINNDIAVFDKYNLYIETFCSDLANYKRLNNEGIYTILNGCCFVGSFLGIFLENRLFFKNNNSEWTKFNYFFSDEKLNLSTKLSSQSEVFKYDNNAVDEKDYNTITNSSSTNFNTWNDTSKLKTVFRIITLIICCGVLFLPNLLIPSSSRLEIVFIFKVFLPNLLLNIFIFGFYKMLCLKLGLSG